MNIKVIIGNAFRSIVGMPNGSDFYDIRLLPYRKIVDCIISFKNMIIRYFEENNYYSWGVNQNRKIIANADFINGIISSEEYDKQMLLLNHKDEIIINGFVESSEEYFVLGTKRKLDKIKSECKDDQIIAKMNFDSWFGMKSALELSKTIISIVENSDHYIDSNKIAEIRDKYLYERHIRRGR